MSAVTMHANRLARSGRSEVRGTFTASRQPNRRSLIVRANWGAPVEFSKANVVSNKQLFPGMHQMVVDVGTGVSSGYTKPGQYIQAKIGAEDKAGFFAIASAPGHPSMTAGTVELLIKAQPGSTAEAIAGLVSGADVLVSPAQGKGFPLDKIPASEVDTVLMFAAGTGVSPLKAVIESGLLDAKHRKSVHLFYGTKNKDTTAYQTEIAAWEESGVKVTQVFSEDRKHYVQAVLETQLKAGLIASGAEARVGVLLSGQKDMCNTITELLTACGVSKDRILMNF